MELLMNIFSYAGIAVAIFSTTIFYSVIFLLGVKGIMKLIKSI